MVWIHGCRQDPEEFAAGTRIARLADERGFLVLLPRQARMANSERCWNWFDRRTIAGAGEAAIVLAQAAEAMQKFKVDPRRVYVAGLSSGGTLAATLALRAPQRQGTRARVHDPRRGRCHGDAGEFGVPGAAVPAVQRLPAGRAARRRRAAAGTGALPPGQVRAFQPRAAYLTSDYHAGRRLAARLVTIPGLGHAWSGGDAAYRFFDAGQLDATQLICDFFAAHSP